MLTEERLIKREVFKRQLLQYRSLRNWNYLETILIIYSDLNYRTVKFHLTFAKGGNPVKIPLEITSNKREKYELQYK